MKANNIYIDVLRENLCNIILKLGISNSYYFQQDNDPKAHCMHSKYIVVIKCKKKINCKNYDNHQSSIRLQIYIAYFGCENKKKKF